MVKAEPYDEGPSVNVITRNGMATGVAKEKFEVEPLIWKVGAKQENLDLQKEKETFIPACKDFTKEEAPISKAPTSLNPMMRLYHFYRHV